LRYIIKKKYSSFIKKHCPHDPRSAQLLTALTIGNIEDRLLQYEFKKIGMFHILAISGFHFGILIAFFSFILSFLVPRNIKWFFLFITLTAYYLLIGSFPGVERSWLTAVVYLIGKKMHRYVSGLNLAGFARGVELIENPLIAVDIGFQFSFTSCFGILLLYPILEKLLQSILPKRTPAEKGALSILGQHVCVVSQFFRQTLAINLAITATILPLLLVHLHTFPLLSLIYNLFYPFCIGLTLSSLLASVIVHFCLPFLSTIFFSITEWLSHLLLIFASYPPPLLDYSILAPDFPIWAVFFSFLLVLLTGIHGSMDKKLDTDLNGNATQSPWIYPMERFNR